MYITPLALIMFLVGVGLCMHATIMRPIYLRGLSRTLRQKNMTLAEIKKHVRTNGGYASSFQLNLYLRELVELGCIDFEKKDNTLVYFGKQSYTALIE